MMWTVFVVSSVLYILAAVAIFAWGLVPLARIGHQRQDWYYEDLQQMHWERCVLESIPRLGVVLLMFSVPVLVALWALPSVRIAEKLTSDHLGALLVVWGIGLVAGFTAFVGGSAFLGGVYFALFRKEEHAYRYQHFKDATLLANAAYGPSHGDRQLRLMRPLRGTRYTRQRGGLWR
jgi:hypothetical protein